MGKNPQQRSFSFYKILVDDNFNSQLRIPPQFVKNHADNLSENATLYIESGGDYSWVVRIEQIGQHHFFTDGWSRFAHDVDLKFREFMLFKLVGKSTFEVLVYCISGCLKELGYTGPIQESDDDDDLENDDNHVVRELTIADTAQLEIPRDFAMGTGIVGNRELKLQDWKGRKWGVHVTARRCGKFAITAGWNEFLTGNRVVVGSVVSLKMARGTENVIKAKVLKTGASGELFVPGKKGRGRPPKLAIG